MAFQYTICPTCRNIPQISHIRLSIFICFPATDKFTFIFTDFILIIREITTDTIMEIMDLVTPGQLNFQSLIRHFGNILTGRRYITVYHHNRWSIKNT